MFIKREKVIPFEFDNLKITDYTAGQDNSSSIAEITIPSGISHKVSWSNRSDKYYYVVEGSVVFIVDEESEVLTAGDVCIIPKGALFSYRNDSLETAKIILLHTPSFKLECEEYI